MTNELRQAAERLLHDGMGGIDRPVWVSKAVADLAKFYLSADLDQLRRDAARYRWLRERRILRDDIYVSLHHPPDMNGKAVDHPHGDELDAAIDTAMQKEPTT